MSKKLLLLAAVGLLLPAGPALAGSVKLSDTGNGTSPGGEFGVEVVGAFAQWEVGDTFATFCMEKDEYIQLGKVYQVEISDEAWRGGKNTDDGDPLDAMTAYLYQNYVDGTLEDINGVAYVPTNDAHADALQWAIWYIEEEVTTISGKAKDFYDAAWEATHEGADGDIEWTGIGNVRVMQLYAYDGTTKTFAQDQLTIVPLPPAALAGLGLLGGLGALRRLRRRRRT